MNAVTASDVSLLAPHSSEWTSLCAHRHNVLIEGPVAATQAVVRLLQPHIHEPIVWKRPQAPFELPSGEARALILEDVAALTVEDQVQLLARLSGRGFRTQVVSTSEQPLFAMVTRGLFDAALYFRLNVVLLRVDVNDQRGSQARHTEQGRSRDLETGMSTPQPA